MNLFKNEEGSTSLTIIVAIVLVVALLALSLQWYWVQTSSADIQHLADMGALSAMQGIGMTVSAIQVIDFCLAAANLFGLIVHGVVAISGVVIAVGGPAASSALAPFYLEAKQFSKSYSQAKKRFSDSAYEVAKKICDVAPLYALGYSQAYFGGNAELMSKYNNTTYHLMAIPFPAKGTLSRTGYKDEENLRLKAEEESSKNAKTAREIAALQKELDGVIDEMYMLDRYQKSTQLREGYSIATAVHNHKVELSRLERELSAMTSDLRPIQSSSEPAFLRLAEIYESTKKQIINEAYKRAEKDLGTYQALTRRYNSQLIDAEALLINLSGKEYYILNHEDGERKAYHADADCSGLRSASAELGSCFLFELLGDLDHPPCSLCLPLHWVALLQAEEQLKPFANNWNPVADAIVRAQDLQASIYEMESELQGDIKSFFDEIAEMAEQYMQSGRLTYKPPGSRGVLSIVVASGERKLPGFTLPSFTKAERHSLGPQFAMSAARLYPSTRYNTVSTVGSKMIDAGVNNTTSFRGAIRSLFGGKGIAVKILEPLWKSSTQMLSEGQANGSDFFNDLPWGIDQLGSQFVTKLSKAAGTSKPDLRAMEPFLVNTASIGSVEAGGAEAQFVESLASSKKVFEQSGGLSVRGLKEIMYETIDSYEDDATSKLLTMFPMSMEGGGFALPLTRHFTTVVSRAVTKVKDEIHQFIELIPDTSF